MPCQQACCAEPAGRCAEQPQVPSPSQAGYGGQSYGQAYGGYGQQYAQQYGQQYGQGQGKQGGFQGLQ